VPELRDKFIRFYSEKKEDIFNIDVPRLKPYSLLSKVIHCPDLL